MADFRILSCLFLFILASCSGSSPHKRRSGSTASHPIATPVPSSGDFHHCLGDLNKEGVHYQLVPDRTFDNGCSIYHAVTMTSAQVPITHLGPLQCPAAENLAYWIDDAVLKSAKVWLGSPVIKVETFGSYSCRTRNSRAGAKISEHGRANAVDISAFDLADGRRITVKEGWRYGDRHTKDFLRSVFHAACRRFSVVISPDGDEYHQDHIHMDLGQSQYCH